ncbi:hypothetical protein SAMN05661096_03083 [Marivirga sericea]|uniref:Uncharacterized protein n=1 Tax=Marivirga sericea TaxID=1028 RepID=A0A1X7KS81_9BACT|nr:hypothetical protein [Marivirga sericea]SMG44004.1 hypothetical protein SAMN05661096_03083 [Marivirga sericea]
MIVLINNRWVNNKVTELGKSFGSVYKERLLIENYIFQLATATRDQKYLLSQFDAKENSENICEIEAINNEIAFLIKDYQNAYLIIAEKEVFEN